MSIDNSIDSSLMDDRGPRIITHTGKAFHFPPADNEIDIRDIAHALSQMCRFNGHTSVPFTVAQHCLEVSKQLPPEKALAGLLHDASEAYLADISRPVKNLPQLNGYRELERSVQSAINTHYNLVVWADLDMAVQEADNRAVVSEAVQFLDAPAWTSGLPRLSEWITVLPGWRAEQVFLERFFKLTPGLFSAPSKGTFWHGSI